MKDDLNFLLDTKNAAFHSSDDWLDPEGRGNAAMDMSQYKDVTDVTLLSSGMVAICFPIPQDYNFGDNDTDDEYKANDNVTATIRNS